MASADDTVDVTTTLHDDEASFNEKTEDEVTKDEGECAG